MVINFGPIVVSPPRELLVRVLHLKAQSVRWPTCCWRDGVRHLKVERGDWLWSRSGPVRVVEPPLVALAHPWADAHLAAVQLGLGVTLDHDPKTREVVLG